MTNILLIKIVKGHWKPSSLFLGLSLVFHLVQTVPSSNTTKDQGISEQSQRESESIKKQRSLQSPLYFLINGN